MDIYDDDDDKKNNGTITLEKRHKDQDNTDNVNSDNTKDLWSLKSKNAHILKFYDINLMIRICDCIEIYGIYRNNNQHNAIESNSIPINIAPRIHVLSMNILDSSLIYNTKQYNFNTTKDINKKYEITKHFLSTLYAKNIFDKGLIRTSLLQYISTTLQCSKNASLSILMHMISKVHPRQQHTRPLDAKPKGIFFITIKYVT